MCCRAVGRVTPVGSVLSSELMPLSCAESGADAVVEVGVGECFGEAVIADVASLAEFACVVWSLMTGRTGLLC